MGNVHVINHCITKLIEKQAMQHRSIGRVLDLLTAAPGSNLTNYALSSKWIDNYGILPVTRY